MTEDSEILVDKPLSVLLQVHFDDDKRDFTEIKKNQEKFQELTKTNGEHLSFFRADLTEIKRILQKQNETFSGHVHRIEPMISAYERDQQFYATIGIKGKKWSKNVGYLAGAIISMGIIKAFIIDHIKW